MGKRPNLVARVTKQVDRVRETEEEKRKKLSGESGKKKGGTERVLVSK